MSGRCRREFLADVGRGMLLASVGAGVAQDMGLAHAVAAEAGKDRLKFGKLEPLVALMQDTPAEKLIPQLVKKLNEGTDLRTLVVAGALANARTFAGEDYIGYHSFMALGPSYQMSQELSEAERPLPVLKVLYRNTSRMQAQGGSKHERLGPIDADELPAGRVPGEVLQERTRKRDGRGAERAFAALTHGPAGEAFEHLQYEVQDEMNVHRVVLSWRAWTMLDLAGPEYAGTLLRQSLRYCIDAENRLCSHDRPLPSIRGQLPKLFDQYKLVERPLGARVAEDAWIEQFSRTIYSASADKAADAAAAALAEGIAPESIGEAISLAANHLVLRDPGRRPEQAQQGKPPGSVHGDSVGVHASDAANAWRNIARVSNQRNTAASLIVGAAHTAGQSGGQKKEAYPLSEHLAAVEGRTPAALLAELDKSVRANDQFRSAAVASRYAELGGTPEPIFNVLLGFATSEDGALHAEKYYRTVTEEFGRSRPALRWQRVVALARVTASEYGRTAPGYLEARSLLMV